MSPESLRHRARARGACGIAAALLLGLAGCSHAPWQAPRAGHPVHVSEVVALSMHGVAPDQIVAKMNRGGLVYDLTEADYVEIRKRGVTPQVIAYMRSTYTQAVKQFPKLANDKTMSCWYLGPDGYWYGGGPHGFHPDC